MKDRSQPIKEYDRLLQKHIDRKDFVTLERSHGDNLTGFILDFSSAFLLLHLNIDFLPDGYAIVPRDSFDYLRCGRSDRMSKRIYKGERLLETAKVLERPSLKSWPDLFRNLRELDYHVIVECEDQEEPEFFIGPVKKVLKQRVGIQHYNGVGKFDEELTTIAYNDITIIRFGDRYSTIFRKYLK